MSIKFDTQSMLANLRIQLILAIKQLQQELLDEAKQKMLTPEGSDDLSDEQITDIANIITANILGGAWTIMDEHGTGSRMDKNNPALEDYKNSNMWNPARKDYIIRSRPNAPGQIDIFGNPINGKGKGGVDLEALGMVTPQQPSKAVETAFRWMGNGRLQEKLKEVIEWFPFMNYFITD